MRVFLSYPFKEETQGGPDSAASPTRVIYSDEEQFVHRVNYFLRRQGLLDSCSYSEERDRPDPEWRENVGPKLVGCEGFVLFVGRRFGHVQEHETRTFLDSCPNDRLYQRLAVVRLPGSCDLPPGLFQVLPAPISVGSLEGDAAEECAREVVRRLAGVGRGALIEPDGLPTGYPFDYEKAILKEFVEGGGRLVKPRRLEQGCPQDWPAVETIEDAREYPNPVEENVLGTFRPLDQRVSLTGPEADGVGELAFPEAGPRGHLRLPRRGKLKIGILVSGGIAPGINAVIAGIVERHHLYERAQQKYREAHPSARRPYVLEVVLYRDGFNGLLRGDSMSLSYEQVRGLADRGGSMVGTSRCDSMLDIGDRIGQSRTLNDVVARLRDIHILYIIGGDGSMRAAHAIWTRMLSRPHAERVSVVGIPKTMDNDILWVWQSFGFLSAVERAKEAILQLNTEVKSNPRLCVVQLFGSDSGFVVSHAALASGVARAALIPEVNFSMRGLSRYIREQLQRQQDERRQQGPHGLILLAETAIPRDVEDYIDNPDYPDLGLEEKEKEAIRRFVGSSMLKVSDVVDWRALSLRLAEGAGVVGPTGRVWESLPGEIRALIPHACAGGRHEAALRSLVVRALNDVLRGPDFYREDYFRGVAAPQARQLLPLAQSLRKRADALPHEEVKRLAQRASIPLPHEAKEMQRRLRDGEELSDEEKTRFALRLIEALNRLLLEAALPEALAPGQATRGERRIHGQTPDELRTGGLKIVSRVLQSDIRNPALMDHDPYWNDFRVFTNEPRHLLRAIRPSASDVIFGHRLGTLAVDNAMAGFTDFMVSQWVTEYVLVPLKLVTLGRKRVPESGIFWRSVLSNTGQPPRM